MDLYEQKYNDALERAKKLYGQGTITESLDFVFPELNEKIYGERIRKELIEHIKANKEADYLLFKKFSPDDVIAWLEKQNKTLDHDKVIEWLHDHIQVDEPKIEYNEDGQPLAESFLAHAKARCMAADEVVKQFNKDFGL